ncbi:sel1 repeat family protein [Nitrogeniibacter mangrovi]|uniref:Sel1 repeat family protein n=1 Tax=Nitrogeniibacter mangrovi TaxID=2016596 RepID=A0A6C1B427_9RHOO|nr:tetratricopeptide repeat protein [Nitrogeniibacter mangrovi]QID18143.1 sel1 repeat family protein [Nitrogeniibacter mangrovi]
MKGISKSHIASLLLASNLFLLSSTACSQVDTEPIYQNCLKLRHFARTKTQEIEAASACIAAAKQNDPRVMTIVGLLYATGKGVMRDKEKALFYWRRGVELKNPTSMRILGAIYQKGKWVEKDEERAKQLYKSAAALGDQVSENLLDQLIKNEKEEKRE